MVCFLVPFSLGTLSHFFALQFLHPSSPCKLHSAAGNGLSTGKQEVESNCKSICRCQFQMLGGENLIGSALVTGLSATGV